MPTKLEEITLDESTPFDEIIDEIVRIDEIRVTKIDNRKILNDSDGRGLERANTEFESLKKNLSKIFDSVILRRKTKPLIFEPEIKDNSISVNYLNYLLSFEWNPRTKNALDGALLEVELNKKIIHRTQEPTHDSMKSENYFFNIDEHSQNGWTEQGTNDVTNTVELIVNWFNILLQNVKEDIKNFKTYNDGDVTSM